MNLKDYFKKAQREGWAIGHFNTSNLEVIRAIVEAAWNLKSPIIIATSEGESRFLGLKQAVSLVKSFKQETKLPLYLNLDHGKTFDYIKEAVDSEYDAIHFDGSELSLKDNIELTKKAVEYAHKKNVLVEGEVGFIQGNSVILKETPEIREEDLTSPEDAFEFVKKTGVDSLAVNVGTFHGMEAGKENPHINLQKLKEIKDKIGDKVFLVLHGGSGTPGDDIKEAIKLGIVKINVNTELRAVFTATLKKNLEESPEEITPYKYLPGTIKEVKKIVEEKIRLFGSVNKI